MKTKQGNNTATLLSIHTGYRVLTLQLRQDVQETINTAYIPAMVDTINSRLASGEKPSGTFQKHLERIEHHRDQLLDAYTELFACYTRLIEPQKRSSPIDATRKAMLDSIPDIKMLRAMCALHIGADRADEYVLPDDKAALIASTVAAMKSAD